MHEPLKATEKAKDLVRMAVHKAALLEPLPTMTIDVNPRGLVIGGGLVGMEAALKLAEQGYEVYLVEREDELGGNLRYIYHTLEGDSPRERIAELRERVQGHDGIQVFTGSEIEEIEGYVGNFRTRVCSGGGTKEFEHGIIIVATGAVEYRPTEYLYGKHAGVITQRELEKRIACDQLALGEGQNIVMIQCVGSRNEEHPYCSRICCSEAIKNALRTKEMIPNTSVYILFRDIRTYGFMEDFYQKAREKGVIFIRYEQGREPVVESNGGKLEVKVYEPLLEEEIALETDLLVLGAATVPPDENQRLAQMLKVPLNEDGFFLEAHMKLRPVDLATEGIFLAGLAHGPKFIEESISQARAAVSRACTILSKKHIEVPAQISVVEEQKCVGCGLCEAVCPTHAIEVGEKRTPFGEKRVAQVNKALCKGCGICAASCRSGSIDLLGFTDEEIVFQLSHLAA
jgi:heterodisulfide reductase subunit A